MKPVNKKIYGNADKLSNNAVIKEVETLVTGDVILDVANPVWFLISYNIRDRICFWIEQERTL